MFKVNKPKPYKVPVTNPNFDKDQYKGLKAWAAENGVRFVLTDRAVAAYCKTTYGEDCRMIAVAVSWCAPEDTFKKKVGKYQALCKLYDGQYVQLPLAYEFDNFPSSVEGILADMFNL